MALENQPSFTAPSLPKMGRSTIASSVISGAGKIGSGNPKLKTSKISFQNAGGLKTSKIGLQDASSSLKLEKNSDIAASLEETNTVLVEIQKQLALDFANRIVERKDRISSIKKQRDAQKKMARESSVESPLSKISKKSSGVLNKVMAPTKNIFDKIIEFLSLIGTGILVEEAFKWFSDKENRKNLEKVFTFLTDNWKILAGIFIGGKILGGILKLVGAAKALRGLLRRVGLLKNKGICGCSDLPGRGRNRIPRGFRTPRGGGTQFSRFFRAGANQAPIGRMGSLINESTGQATRMLGANKAVDVLGNLKNAGVSNANRARVLAGQLSETQALDIARKNTGILGNLRQNIGGIFAQGRNLGRGIVSQGQELIGGAYRGIKGFGSNVMDLGRTVGKGLMDAGGAAVSGLKSTWDNIGKTVANLDPRKLPEVIQNAVKGEIDKLKKGSPIFKKLMSFIKNPKDFMTLLADLVSKAKPAVKGIKDARKAVPFKIPGVDVLISSLIAAVEIGTGAPAGNALLGALGGVLGSAAGTTIGSFAGPPGALIGAMAGGVGGELLFRQIASAIGSQVEESGASWNMNLSPNGAPLFSSSYDPMNFGSEEEPVEGKKFGGMIQGPGHGAGGVKVEAEGGEGYILNRYAASKNRAFLDDENFNQGKQLAKFAKGVSQQQKSLGIQLDNVNRFEEVTKEFNDILKEKIRKQEELKNKKDTPRNPPMGGGEPLHGDRVPPGPMSLQVIPYSPRERSLQRSRPSSGGTTVINAAPVVEPKSAPAVLQQSAGADPENTIEIDSYDETNEYIIEAYERYGIFL